MAQPSKVILVFCDGTGMDGILGCEYSKVDGTFICINRDIVESVPAGSQEKSVTNVLRLCKFSQTHSHLYPS